MTNSNYEERTMKSTKIFDGKVLQLRVDTVEMEGQKYTKREIVKLFLLNNIGRPLTKRFMKSQQEWLTLERNLKRLP